MRECIVAPTLTIDDTSQTLTLTGEIVDSEIFNPDDSAVLAIPIDVEGICPVVHSQFFRLDGSFQLNNTVLLGPN